ncbi:hypothetical protein BDV93DRAFT_560671 [Ceratobasidium sp. AG-I]|nr:hypothetical protein BDV93DRAFT_560671 [Ceratobasidium sp. AG-I]
MSIDSANLGAVLPSLTWLDSALGDDWVREAVSLTSRMPPRKLPSLREKVIVSPDPSRPATPEPTTSSGVSRGRALYDDPLPDSQADNLGQTHRRRRSTSRGITWAEAVEKSATRSHRVQRT